MKLTSYALHLYPRFYLFRRARIGRRNPSCSYHLEPAPEKRWRPIRVFEHPRLAVSTGSDPQSPCGNVRSAIWQMFGHRFFLSLVHPDRAKRRGTFLCSPREAPCYFYGRLPPRGNLASFPPGPPSAYPPTRLLGGRTFRSDIYVRRAAPSSRGAFPASLDLPGSSQAGTLTKNKRH
jgi:hypothetical protein